MGFENIGKWIDNNIWEIAVYGVFIAGGTYFLANLDDYRGDEKVIQQINLGQYVVRVVQEDRQFVEDLYRLEVLDGEGHTIVKTCGSVIPTFTFPSNPKSDSLEKRVEE